MPMEVFLLVLLGCSRVNLSNVPQQHADADKPSELSRILLEDMSELVVDLKKHFYTSCIFLVYAEGQLQQGRLHLRFQQLLAGYLVPSAAVPVHAANEVSCGRNAPMFVMLSDSAALQRGLQQLSRGRVLAVGFWLLLSLRELDRFLDGVNLPFDGEFLVARPHGRGLRLSEVYRVAEGLPLRRHHYGDWALGHVGEWPGLELYKRRSDLRGLVLPATSIQSAVSPLVRRQDNRLEVGGFIGSIWYTIEQQMNFTTVVSEPPDKSFGSMASNGSWNGMVGMVARREAHLAIAPFAISPARTAVLDFTIPIFLSKYYVFIKRVLKPTASWGSLLLPFSPLLWCTVGAALLGNALVLTICSRIAQEYKAEERNDLGFRDALLLVFGAFTQQGSASWPQSTPCRIVCLFTYLAALVVAASYSASVVSFLAVLSSTAPFHDFDSLLEDGTYNIGVVANSADDDLFRRATEPVLQLVFSRLMEPDARNFPASNWDGLSMVCARNHYGFLASDLFMQSLVGHENCSVLAVPINIVHTAMAIALQKDSPYRGVLNFHLQGLRGAGLMQRLRTTLWDSPARLRASNTAHVVSLWDVVPLLAVLGLGALLAGALLALERRHSAAVKGRTWREGN